MAPNAESARTSSDRLCWYIIRYRYIPRVSQFFSQLSVVSVIVFFIEGHRSYSRRFAILTVSNSANLGQRVFKLAVICIADNC